MRRIIKRKAPVQRFHNVLCLSEAKGMGIKMKKKTFVILLLLLVVMFPSKNVFAENDGVFVEDEIVSEESGIIDYLLKVAPQHLSDMFNVGETSLRISQSFTVATTDDCEKYMFFVFENEVSKGYFLVSKVDVNYFSTYANVEISEITDAYEENENISVYQSNGSMFIVAGSDILSFGEDNDISILANNLYVVPEKIELLPYEIEVAETVQVLDYAKTVSVGIVRNTTINGSGACWAASLSSIINVRKSTSLTATSLYEKLASIYPEAEYGNPEGSENWIKRAFSIHGLSYSKATGAMSPAEIYNALNAGRPIYMSLVSSSGYHAVVLFQLFYSENDGMFIKIMDPNDSYYSSINYSASSASSDVSFTYSSTSGTYTSWRYAYY